MPQTLPGGKREAEPSWPLVPIAARVLRHRRRKEETLVLLRRVPVALPSMTDAEAPVAVRIAGETRPHAAEWAYLRHIVDIPYVRHDGEAWWRPVSPPGGTGTLRLDGLPGALESVRESGGGWRDWPFGLPLATFASRKTAVIAEADLVAKAVRTDVDAAALAEAVALAGRYALVDGVLHRRCDEPVLEVRAIGLGTRKVVRLVTVPKAAHDEETRGAGAAETLQAFRPDDLDAALAYATGVSRALGRGAVGGRVFSVEGPGLSRRDEESLPREATARFVARSRELVGSLGRPAVEAWLDLRDAGAEGGLDAVASRFGRMLDRLIEDHPHHWATALAWFEAKRLLPDAYTAGEEDEDALAEDAAALAGVA